MIRGIHHVSLKCAGEELYAKTKDFYTNVLGLSIAREWSFGVMIEAGNTWIEIMNTGEGNTEIGAVRHFAFYTDDTDDMVRRVKEAGYEITTEPKDICLPSEPPIPARIAFCYGPLHEQIEFFNDQSDNAKRFF